MAIVPVQRPIDEVQHLDGAALDAPFTSLSDAERLLDALGVTGRIRRMSKTGERGIQNHKTEPRDRAMQHLARAAAAGANTWLSTSEFDNSGSGTAEHVIGVSSLTFDLDDAKIRGGRAGAWLLVKVISETLGVQPRAIVDSGHGLQVHYAIDDVAAHWEAGDDDARQHAARVIKRAQKAVRDLAAADGANLDTTDGTERLWRMPGSTNTKPDQVPVATSLISIDPEAEALTLAEIEAAADRVLGAEPEAQPVDQAPVIVGREPGDFAAYERAAVQRELARLDELQRPWSPGSGWDSTTYEVACTLLDLADSSWTALTREEVAALVREHAPRDDVWGAREHHAKLTSAAGKVSGQGRPAPNLYVNALHELPTRSTTAPTEETAAVDAGQSMTTSSEAPVWLQLQREYLLLGDRRPPRDRIFEIVEDSKGEPKITGNLLVETVARYIDQDFADGADRRTYVYADGVYTAEDAEVMRRTAWVLGEQYSRARHGAVADVVSVLPRPTLPDVPDQRFINCRNGMVEVASGTLLPHDPSYLSSVQLPVEYHPGAACPRFDAWLAQVLPADTVPMLWELLGYLLLHGNPLQVAVLLHGSGGNGKGTLLRVVRRLLGNHNVSAVTLAEIAEGKFETAAMYGKQANIAGDIDPRFLKNTAKFKAITGGDVINAQHKNAKPFEFTCWAVPIFSANELWRSADVSRGYFRRWVPIPFPNSVMDGEEPFDEETLYAEATGIFAKALPALSALLRRGRFELSPSSQALLSAFEEQADSVLSWMGEDDWLSTHEPSMGCWTARTKLHGRYRNWCADSGHVALSSTKFYARLGALGFQPLTREGTRGYRGLALLAS